MNRTNQILTLSFSFAVCVCFFALPHMLRVNYVRDGIKTDKVGGGAAYVAAATNQLNTSTSSTSATTTTITTALNSTTTDSTSSNNQTTDVNNQGTGVTVQFDSQNVSHIKTPKQVKAIYISSWVAGTQSLRTKLIALADNTEINAVVIDIKDYTGKMSFIPNDKGLLDSGVGEKRIADIDSLLATLHQKGIYVIGRVATFQDPFLGQIHPEIAVKKASDGKIWKDKKGISWIDAGSKLAWEHNKNIAIESYNRGFDEIQFDYIRYPSDGNMQDIAFPQSNLSAKVTKHSVLKSFFSYLHDELSPKGIIISADLFGMTTVTTDDLGIGQVLGDALTTMDYVSPMVYPSHFPNGWEKFKNPAAKPYEVIQISMSGAVKKAKEVGVSPLKLRPWLQDFNLGATYTDEMVRKQIQATYDVGLNSWLLWSAANHYHEGALEKTQ